MIQLNFMLNFKFDGFRFLLGRHLGWLHQLVGHCVGVRDIQLCDVGGDVLKGGGKALEYIIKKT